MQKSKGDLVPDSPAIEMNFRKNSTQRVEAPVTFKAYLMCAFAAFAGVLFGYDSGYINAVLGMQQFRIDYGHPVEISSPNSSVYNGVAWNYETWQKSLIVSILSAGTFCGALLSGWLADVIGRRVTIIGPGCGIFTIGVVIQITAADVAGLAAGRFVAGLGVGCVSAITILYMSEIAPRGVRGALVAAYQFAITIGIMLASCVGFATQDRTNSGAYRIPIGIQFAWALILGVGLFLLPESPRYWVKKNRLDLAALALGRLRGQPPNSHYIEDELAEIVANCEFEQQLGQTTWKDCFSGGISSSNSNLRKVFIGTAMQMFQQWTGINFIFYFNVTFFQQVNFNSPFLISMVTTVVNVVCTPVSFYAIEKFGRRALLIWGAIFMCICEFTISIIGVVGGNGEVTNYIIIVFVCIYVFFYAATWGPCAWVVVGEIFHLPIRSKGVALSTASNWFWNCVIGIVIPFMVDPDKGNLGVKVFFLWGTTCGFCAVFAWMFVPETKGLTLEQVDRMMEEVPAYTSKHWKPNDTFAPDYGIRQGSTVSDANSHHVVGFDAISRASYDPVSRPGTGYMVENARPTKMESFI